MCASLYRYTNLYSSRVFYLNINLSLSGLLLAWSARCSLRNRRFFLETQRVCWSPTNCFISRNVTQPAPVKSRLYRPYIIRPLTHPGVHWLTWFLIHLPAHSWQLTGCEHVCKWITTCIKFPSDIFPPDCTSSRLDVCPWRLTTGEEYTPFVESVCDNSFTT